MSTNIFCLRKIVHKNIITFLCPRKLCPQKMCPLNCVHRKSLISFSLSKRHNTFSRWIIFKQTTQTIDILNFKHKLRLQ